MKLRRVSNDPGLLLFYCPGCDEHHGVWTEAPNAITGAKWGWNGSMDKPTFTPSILVRYRHPKGYSNDNPAPVGWEGEYVDDICHSFITDGKIQFLNDCTHHLAGQTIELTDIDD